jgi:hypothetical protein
MADFDLDLRAAESELGEATEGDYRMELAVLDGTTPAEEWIDAVETGTVLVLAVEGDLNELAAGFARDVRDAGGALVHFRGFLIVAPPDVEVDTDRLG